eukprot:c28204_g1_i1 orf=155-2068(+)
MWRIAAYCRTLSWVSRKSYIPVGCGALHAADSPSDALLHKVSHPNHDRFWLGMTLFGKALRSQATQSGRSETSSSSSQWKMWNSMLTAAVGSTCLGASTFLDVAANEGVQNGDKPDESLGDGKENIFDTEKVIAQAKRGIEERLKFLNIPSSALPPFSIAVKGQQVAIRIPVSPVSDIWRLIVDVIARMGKSFNGVYGEKMLVSALKSAVALVLMMEHPEQKNDKRLHDDLQGDNKKDGSSSNTLCVWVFEPLIGEQFPEIEFLKKGHFLPEELDMIVSTMHIASGVGEDSALNRFRKSQLDEKSGQGAKRPREREDLFGGMKKTLESLEAMGVKVYGLDYMPASPKNEISWDNIAGYHEQKREIEDTVLLALRCPDIYDSIARGTRHKYESNRPRAILFEGPPGTGKTSCARVIANQSGVPLLYVPLEVVMSKYYGESERLLGKVFNAANELPAGSIIFLDEIDSLATTRDSEMHEATRRILSVLLRQIDGFEQDTRVVVIAATNRKEDLDPALISRFDSSITFDLPDQHTREEIAAQYARHLSSSELASVAAMTDGMSGRDLRDICQQAERHWASKLIRGQAGTPSMVTLPSVEEYIDCAENRKKTLQKWPGKQGKESKDRLTGDGKKAWPSVVV